MQVIVPHICADLWGTREVHCMTWPHMVIEYLDHMASAAALVWGPAWPWHKV